MAEVTWQMKLYLLELGSSRHSSAQFAVLYRSVPTKKKSNELKKNLVVTKLSYKCVTLRGSVA